MDSNSNHATGMNLSGSAGGQGAAAGPLDSGETASHSAQMASQVPIEEVATDEELDQLWVNKAKDIVEQTKADPFTQSNELNKVKAEYLKIRFDKEFNVGDKTPQ